MNSDKKYKYRVWWNPQVGGVKNMFYVLVETPEEGWLVWNTLARYDLYQLEENIKPDFCNAGGLEYYDEENESWWDWYDEDGADFDEHFENREFNEREADE